MTMAMTSLFFTCSRDDLPPCIVPLLSEAPVPDVRSHFYREGNSSRPLHVRSGISDLWPRPCVMLVAESI